jgi:hypothetical protein
MCCRVDELASDEQASEEAKEQKAEELQQLLERTNESRGVCSDGPLGLGCWGDYSGSEAGNEV